MSPPPPGSLSARHGPSGPGAAQPPPYVPYWHPGSTELPKGGRSILDWDPEQDPDARFNRSRVRLRKRTRSDQLKANAKARVGEGRIMSCAEFWGTEQNPAQGVADHRYYAFGHWQYVDSLVFWAGVAGSGLICPPNGHITDAAHRNGVKVYGSVFFPPTAFGGKKAWVEDFVLALEPLDPGGVTVYPVAEKLVEVAQYFGFDGWFINYETPTDATTEAALRRTLAAAQAMGQVEFVWYQNGCTRLSDDNAPYLQENGRRVCDSVFIDYDWDNAGIEASRTKATSMGRDKHEVHFGLELVAEAANKAERVNLLYPMGTEHRGSLALYAAHTVSSQPREAPKHGWLERFHAAEADFWSGTCHDPSDSGWPGIARYIGESTTVLNLPFVTHFNAGHGTAYHHAGRKILDSGDGWANLSLQDILPIYRWITRAENASKIRASLCFDDAWEGGSCLRLTGSLASSKGYPEKPANVRLYQARLTLTQNTKVTVRARTPAGTTFRLRALLTLANDPPKVLAVPLQAAGTTDNGWTTYTAALAGHKGATAMELGLQLLSTAPDDVFYDVRVGQFAVHDEVRPAARTGRSEGHRHQRTHEDAPGPAPVLVTPHRHRRRPPLRDPPRRYRFHDPPRRHSQRRVLRRRPRPEQRDHHHDHRVLGRPRRHPLHHRNQHRHQLDVTRRGARRTEHGQNDQDLRRAACPSGALVGRLAERGERDGHPQRDVRTSRHQR